MNDVNAVKRMKQIIRERRRVARLAPMEFVRAAIAGDVPGMKKALHAAANTSGWRRVMKAIAPVPVPEEFRDFFLSYWISHGDHIRGEVGDDLTLIAGLRALLPPYQGPAVRLFRGDSMLNRRRRTYGLSWSSSREVADCFARSEYQLFEGGSVVLETWAAPEAIICAPARILENSVEEEYIVDRRRLSAVSVIARYPQLTLEEFDAAQRAMAEEENDDDLEEVE